MRKWWLLVLALGASGLVWLWRTARDAPVAVEPAPRDRAPVAARRVPRLAVTAPPPVGFALSRRESRFDASSHHTADPCTAVAEPIIPATYETITAANITVAWDPAEVVGPYDAPLRPVSLAFAVAGLLEEAAQLTGTDRRASLAVIVDATPEAFHARMRTPAWVDGLYDGAAVHLAAKPNLDLGVRMSTLRHEVMHAQMHATVGCTPFWFNEGLASYFAGSVPTREWMTMLRTGEPFDLARLREPAVLDLEAENAARMYAVSLAMVLYIVHARGELGLREAVRVAQAADSIPTALELWSRTQPNIDYRAILEMLAQRILGLPLGPELDAVLGGSLCCRNLRSPAGLTCRAPTPDLTRREICRRW